MRFRLLLILPLFAWAAPRVPAGEGPPLILFKEPDPATRKEITDDLLSNNGLGAGTRDKRTTARARLREIGYWTVPFLSEAVHGPRSVKGVRIPMNALMVLARILDLRALPAIRGAAEKHEDADVRKTAGLALGLYRRAEDRALLTRLLQDSDFRRSHQSSAALALAKLRNGEAREVLRAAAQTPARDVHVAAATLLAAVIAQPGIDLSRYLESDEKLLRAVAAVALLLRPLEARDAEVVLDLLRRPREDREVRALHYLALGAVRDRTDEIRQKLLTCVVRSQERPESQIAALMALAWEEGRTELYSPLKSFYRSVQGRNDPVVAALLLALARTGDPKAVDDLLSVVSKGSDFLSFYAAGSLLYLIADLRQPLDREPEIFDALAKLRDRPDPLLREVAALSLRVRAEGDRAKRPSIALEGFAQMGDPRSLHLWDWDPAKRAWGNANDLLPMIFQLDDVAERGKSQVPPVGPPGAKEPRAGGTPEEQDLLDFFGEKPYLGPEDLGGG